MNSYLCGKVTAGSRVTIIGIFSIFQEKSKVFFNRVRPRNRLISILKRAEGAVAVRRPYIRVVGMDSEHQSGSRGVVTFTDSEEEALLALSRRPDIYETFTGSIAPSIFGNEGTAPCIFASKP